MTPTLAVIFAFGMTITGIVWVGTVRAREVALKLNRASEARREAALQDAIRALRSHSRGRGEVVPLEPALLREAV